MGLPPPTKEDITEARILSSKGQPYVALVKTSRAGDQRVWESDLATGVTMRTGSTDYDHYISTQNPQHHPDLSLHTPTLGWGEFHPRIFRPGARVRRVEETWMKNRTYRSYFELHHQTSRQTAHVVSLALYDQFQEVLRAVEPTDANKAAYGHTLRQLLMLAATEVESSWREVLRANGLDPARPTTKDYVKLLRPMRLDEWTVKLESYPTYPAIAPFNGWDPDQPSQSLPWYQAYHAVKHDRDGELNQARLDHIITAMAAVAVMGWAQFGERVIGIDSVPHTARFVLETTPSWSGEEAYYGPEDPLLPDLAPVALEPESPVWTPVRKWV